MTTKKTKKIANEVMIVGQAGNVLTIVEITVTIIETVRRNRAIDLVIIGEVGLEIVIPGGEVETDRTNQEITEVATKNEGDLVLEIIMPKDRDMKMIIKTSFVITAKERRKRNTRGNQEAEVGRGGID